jgi:hypothetical protein
MSKEAPMPDKDITGLIPLLGTYVWVQTAGFTRWGGPVRDDFHAATLRTVLADDMGAWCVVEWGDGTQTKHPWHRVSGPFDPPQPVIDEWEAVRERVAAERQA